MKKMLITICLLIGMLVSGCGQNSQIQSGYKIKSTQHGVVVLIDRSSYNLETDIRKVWNDENGQFKNHTIFWTTVCVYPFFGMPFTEIPTYVIQLGW